MIDYILFWLSKTVAEFFAFVVVAVVIILFIVVAFFINIYIIEPYNTAKEKKLWLSQTPQWRRNKFNSMNDSFRMEDWPKKWQRDMVEEDRRGYK